MVWKMNRRSVLKTISGVIAATFRPWRSSGVIEPSPPEAKPAKNWIGRKVIRGKKDGVCYCKVWYVYEDGTRAVQVTRWSEVADDHDKWIGSIP